MSKYTYYCEETGETYDPEPSPFPFVGETRFFLEDGVMVEYEFTEEGCWVEC